jgi:hypothetical protein
LIHIQFQNVKEIAYFEAYEQFRHHYNNVWRVQEFFTTAELAVLGAAAAISQISNKPVLFPIEVLLFVGFAISLGGFKTLVRARYYYLREIANLAVLERLLGLDTAEKKHPRCLLRDEEKEPIEKEGLPRKGLLERMFLIGKVGELECPDYWSPNFAMQYAKGDYARILYDPERWVRNHVIRRQTITFYFFILQVSAMVLFIVLMVIVGRLGTF